MIDKILNKTTLDRDDIIFLLNLNPNDSTKLFEKSIEIKNKNIGNKVYFRGLIEFSNICEKDCFYCGIRKSNSNFKRYNLTDSEILDSAKFAYTEKYGSIVLQSGEISSCKFTNRIENLLREIKTLSNNTLGVTISLGEQSEKTYKKWFKAGAHRYLLRIETSSKDLYEKIHPKNKKHSFEDRLNCLKLLKETGYQVGTGVMVGLPFQTIENLADDLLFMKNLDIDMCGMGPYIEHEDTPLFRYKTKLLSPRKRFVLTLKMIAILRIIMPNINIAASTAMQAIDPIGREKALKIGANIIMPNITPVTFRNDYSLYKNKPCTNEEASDCKNCLEARINIAGSEIAYNEWGDSLHFTNKHKNKLSQI